MITYAELDAGANQLARLLLSFGVNRGDVVGVLAERGPETIVGALAALKAGAAYAPLDPGSPSLRINQQIASLRAPLVLAPGDLAGRCEDIGAPVVTLDPQRRSSSAMQDDRLELDVKPADLFAVIFTSGSTGRPKAVALEHHSMLNLLDGTKELAPSPGEGALQVCAPQFDVAAYELWATLVSGGRLVCHPSGRPDPAEVCATVVEHRVTWAAMATSTFHQVAEHGSTALRGMRILLTGGEQLLPRYARRFRADCPRVRLFNIYGPTETTVFFCAHEVSAEDERGVRVPVGRPLNGARLLVADANGAPARGQRGELHVGGPVLARGYLHEPELTAERFVVDPKAGRMYRTGDIVIERLDGAIEIVGRVDDQVKLRGYRVEPGEVEAQLLGHPSVQDAAVVVREDAAGNRRLIAYVVSGSDVGEGQIRAYLAARLPEYMLPSTLVTLDRLPSTARGKVDRQALRARAVVDGGRSGPAGDNAPTSELTTMIAAVFAEVLGLEEVAPEDDFLKLGGDSLAAVQALVRLRERHELDLPLAAIFDAPTARGLAEHATNASPRRAASLPSLRAAARPLAPLVPATAGQAKTLLIGELADESLPYQSQAIHRILGALDAAALERSLVALVARHEILRTSFHQVDGAWMQRVHDDCHARLPLVDLSTGADRERALSEFAADIFRRRLDPGRAPLACWSLARLAEDDHALICLEHHAIHDGVSTARFLEELALTYAAELSGQSFPVPPLGLQYRDFALWQADLAGSACGEQTLAYWQQQLAGAPAELPLPLDHPRSARQTYRGDTLRLTLAPKLAVALEDRAAAWSATTFTVMLAAYAALLARYAGVEELVVGSGFANRRTLASEQLLGMVVNSVALRIDLTGSPTVRELVQRVRNTVIEAQGHQDVPFEQVVQHLAPARSANAAPLYQTLFSFHDAPVRTLQLPGAVLVPCDALPNGSAKADLNVVVINRGVHSRPERVDPGLYERTAEDGITIVWEYNRDLLDRTSAERMLGHFERLLEQFVSGDPERDVRALPLTDRAELERALTWGVGPANRAGSPATLAEVFASQVSERPQSIAISFAAEVLTYWQLERRANRLANRLRALGVKRGVRTAVCLERSVDLIVAMLAVVKAGGVYVPLDPLSPARRLRTELDLLDLRLVLTHARHRERLPGSPLRVICLDDAQDLGREPDTAPVCEPSPTDPIYVMFTSGSTGVPKAVEVTHRAVLRLVCGVDYVRLGPDETVLGFAPRPSMPPPSRSGGRF